jgi:hypothetical protein
MSMIFLGVSNAFTKAAISSKAAASFNYGK